MADLMGVFDGPFLKAGDVGDEMVPATIVRVRQEEIGSEFANVAYFDEALGTDAKGNPKNKPMRLNVGNTRMVIQLGGTRDPAQIKNLPVLLFAVETTDKNGSPCMGLRLRKGNARSDAAQQAVDTASEALGESRGGTGTEDNEIPF